MRNLSITMLGVAIGFIVAYYGCNRHFTIFEVLLLMLITAAISFILGIMVSNIVNENADNNGGKQK